MVRREAAWSLVNAIDFVHFRSRDGEAMSHRECYNGIGTSSSNGQSKSVFHCCFYKRCHLLAYVLFPRSGTTMSTSTHLHLFPTTANGLPRKSSLKKPQSTSNTAPSYELKGLALHFTSAANSTPKVLPATDHIKHSLFCESPTPSESTKSGQPFRRRPHARRRSSAPSYLNQGSDASPVIDEDQLSPLPVNTRFGSSSPPRRHPSSQLQRPDLPRNISIVAHPDDELSLGDADQLSPLPEKSHFTPVSPRTFEYPMTHSGSSVPSRSNSAATSRTSPSSSHSGPMRSMFPRYDPSKSLNDQGYFPSTQMPAQRLPSEKISKVSSSMDRPVLTRFDSAMGPVDGYEHVPVADQNDLLTIWESSYGRSSAAGRKVQLGLHQPKGESVSLAVGPSAERPFYSLEKALPQSPSQKSKQAKSLTVEKHSPHGGPPVPVAQLLLPESVTSEGKPESDGIAIFPQTAAMYAIEAISNSPAAAEIATFDPMARSPEAARLAQDAVEEAHRRYGCALARTTWKRDSFGAVTATYTLEHPTLGPLQITVTKLTRQGGAREPKAKISLHHPSATPAAVAAETLVLAFLDFSRDACVLDLPGLQALNAPYLLDTAISALLAIAAMENDGVIAQETLTFAPPPKSPFLAKKPSRSWLSSPESSSSSGSRRWRKRSSRAIDKVQKELVGEPVDVGAPVHAAVALIGLGLKTALFVLEAGVKVTARVVVGVGHMAGKT